MNIRFEKGTPSATADRVSQPSLLAACAKTAGLGRRPAAPRGHGERGERTPFFATAENTKMVNCCLFPPQRTSGDGVPLGCARGGGGSATYP